jgi:ATP-dependent Clp protease adapter protein ClpS
MSSAMMDKPKPRKNYPTFGVFIYKERAHTDEYITSVLAKVFSIKNKDNVNSFLKDYHEKGEMMPWKGSFEIAEFKATLVAGFGPDTNINPNIKEPLPTAVVLVG